MSDEFDNNPTNIFVFGDIVIDHVIPVIDKKTPYQAAGQERVVDGRPRRTFAGGAANCARLVAALGRGRTCLWGLSGHSPWGSFAQILQRSQALDGVENPIIYHGTHNESQPMNTITRIVRNFSTPNQTREFRVDDVPAVRVTDSQVRAAIDCLHAEYEEYGIHAIIINDLNMHALNASLVSEIADFATKQDIALLVDPKRDWGIYRNCNVTGVLPNLSEWSYIVGDINNYDRWRNGIDTQESLQRMAERSLRYMPNAAFHIITCDTAGVVLVAPERGGRRTICHVKSKVIPSNRAINQLGAGDVLSAALAFQFARPGGCGGLTVDRVLEALDAAGAVVACYLQQEWQRVPNRRQIEMFRHHIMTGQSTEVSTRTTLTEGILLLPPSDPPTINLNDLSVRGTRLLSQDTEYRLKIERLYQNYAGGWDGVTARSAVLTGRGGVGKSDIKLMLLRDLAPQGIDVWLDFPCKSCKSTLDVLEVIDDRTAADSSNDCDKILIVIDEAFSNARHLLFDEVGKNLLQDCSGESRCVRFLFIDADFYRHKPHLSGSQFLSRCEIFDLPELAKRKHDIPYIFAGSCIGAMKNTSNPHVRVSESALLAVINWVLETPESDQSSRAIVSLATQVMSRIQSVRQGAGTTAIITERYLPDELKPAPRAFNVSRVNYDFFWPSN